MSPLVKAVKQPSVSREGVRLDEREIEALLEDAVTETASRISEAMRPKGTSRRKLTVSLDAQA